MEHCRDCLIELFFFRTGRRGARRHVRLDAVDSYASRPSEPAKSISLEMLMKIIMTSQNRAEHCFDDLRETLQQLVGHSQTTAASVSIAVAGASDSSKRHTASATRSSTL